MRTIVLSAAVLMCASAAAYAQGKSASKTALGIDPCALLTRQEAAAAVGAAVGEGKSTVIDTPGNSGLEAGGSCAYESPTSVNGLKLNIYRYPPALAAAFRKRCAQKEGVPGLGDAACWYDSRHTQLQIIKGSISVSIDLRRSGDTADALKVVAKKVVERMP